MKVGLVDGGDDKAKGESQGAEDAAKSLVKKQFEKGGPNDISNGPVKQRGCTDILCLIVFILHWFGFLAVTFIGMKDGNPTKLYKPRDFRGDYCDVEKQWNDGSNLKGNEKLTYTMNVTHTIDQIAKQLVCSSAVEAALSNNVMTASQLATYRCACCKSACSTCFGSLNMKDLNSDSSLKGTISGKMGDITGGSAKNEGNMFSPSGMNGDYFSKMWKEATAFFHNVCMPKCTSAVQNLSATNDRSYTYLPSPDAGWYEAWKTLVDHSGIPAGIKDTVKNQFTFKALPRSVCPYSARYCVPFPGVTFNDLPNNYCSFKMSESVMASVGESASKTFEQLAANDVAKDAKNSFGSAWGDTMKTLDAMVVVAILSLVIGLVFLVLLRFFVGAVVWFAIFLVLLVFVASGGFLWIRSAQCKGAGLFESGKQMGQAASISAAAAAWNSVSGNDAPSEDMTGNGADYRGVQEQTKSGLKCQRWDAQYPHKHVFSAAKYNTSDLKENYCRNPFSAPTIWCFTTDPKVRWSICSPVGVIRPDCPTGYVVESETARKAMEVIGCIIWAFGGLWIILIVCMNKRIRLAIAINKCAAMFVYNTPQILWVPLVQAVVGIIWCLLWCISASFLLSQVPASYTPTGRYESYAVAYGTDDTAGKCTDKWPTGFVWKDEGDLSSDNDPCSGNKGDISGITPKCWRCGPPRYIFDVRFAVSFFSLLWNNAFLIALGQCIIAGAVCVWFFAPREQKGKGGTVRPAVRNCFRYHAGSLAMGAFILAVVQFIRYMAYYFEKQAAAQKNKVMVLVLKCVQYCVWCIEKCIKFLNKNAYIQVALLGTNFCRSAKNAFQLILRNMLRFGAIAMLGSVIQFLGFIFIVAATSILGYFILQGLHPDVYPVVPVLLYIVISYLVAKLYMNVFGLAVDTMLQCFIATEEMGGDAGFVPGPLKSFVKDQAGTGDAVKGQE